MHGDCKLAAQMHGGLHIVTGKRKTDEEEFNRLLKDAGDTSNKTLPKFKVVQMDRLAGDVAALLAALQCH